MSKSPTIIINIYIYLIVKKTRVFGIENDQMTMTTLTTFVGEFAEKLVPLQ